jgi:hypothetical protein
VVIVPRTEQLQMLRKLLTEEACTLRLFANDVRPFRGDDTPVRYEEPRGGGYSPIDLDSTRWLFEVNDPDSPVEAAYPEQTFTFNASGVEVFGFMVVGTASGRIKMIERITGAPLVTQRPGDILAVNLRLSLE